MSKRKIEDENDKNKKPKIHIDNEIVVYTDGACSKNGFEGATAGVGVFFGDNDSRNISEKLKGKQTNQRAELTAPLCALKRIDPKNDVLIITDSMYTINCVTNWSKNWIKNGWKTSKGVNVENQDLIKELLDAIKKRKGAVAWKHVRGHTNNHGNDQADKLARAGINK